MKRALHDGMIEYLTQAQTYRDAFDSSNEYDGPQKEIALQFQVQGPISTKLFGLDELTEKTISVPEGNVHNKAYSYRMLTYSAALPNVRFQNNKGKDFEFYLAEKPKPLPRSDKWRRAWRFSWIRTIINWGKKPL